MLPRASWTDALERTDAPLRAALEAMAARVRAFAARQRAQLADFEIETEPGVGDGFLFVFESSRLDIRTLSEHGEQPRAGGRDSA